MRTRSTSLAPLENVDCALVVPKSFLGRCACGAIRYRVEPWACTDPAIPTFETVPARS